MHPVFHLGLTGDIGVQEESDVRGGQILGVEENEGKLRGVRGGDCGVICL